MVDLISPSVLPGQKSPSAGAERVTRGTDVSRNLERLLWTEMLKHTGLEASLTKTGGEGASSFARFMIEAIAEDLAEHHPIGLSKESYSNSIDAIDAGQE